MEYYDTTKNVSSDKKRYSLYIKRNCRTIYSRIPFLFKKAYNLRIGRKL